MTSSSDERRTTVLRAFWADAERPLEEEVRLAVAAAFPGARLVDELEREDDLLWGDVWRLPGVEGEVTVTAEPRFEIRDALFERGLRDPEERRAATAARWLLGVEIASNPARPGATYRAQARVLDAACVPGYVAVYDDAAVAVRSARTIRDVASGAAEPEIASLYAVHAPEGPRGAWVHTHGLTRLGIAELELWGVEPPDVAEATDLLAAIVDAAASGAEPDEEGVLAIGEGVRVRLVDVDEALDVMPPDAAASRREHAEDDDPTGDHDGPRKCVAAVERYETPHDLFDRMAEDAAFYRSPSDSERRRRLAVDRFGVFGQLFAMRRRDGWRFHAKLAFDPAERGAGREHLWFEVTALKPGLLLGACLNAPLRTTAVRRGEENWFALEQLTDWLVVAPEGRFDPEAAPALLVDP